METSNGTVKLRRFIGFYITYEEWKPPFKWVWDILKGSFYITYEEWKLFDWYEEDALLSVFILPMRNGNFNREDLIACEAYVFILPMRNGNMA